MAVDRTRALFVAVGLSLGLPALAVDNGATIKGTVYDTDGIEVPNAEVAIESPAYLGGANQLTDESGRYRFISLPPGDYTVTVEHPGFSPYKSALLHVPLNATLEYDLTLQLVDQGEGDVVTVVSKAPAIDVQNVQTGTTLSGEFLGDLPTGRDYQSAINIAPGIVDNGSGNPNARGGFDSSNQFYVDGVNTTDPVTNTFGMNMNYDAIASIEVITGGMDAEYGRALGGAFNIVTESGGNDFHGAAVFTFSNQDMVFGKLLEGETDREFLSQQFVANLGGPIVKDKIWFFGSIQNDVFKRVAAIDNPDEIRDLERFPFQPRTYKSIYYFAKITAQPAPAHRLELHIQGDPTTIENTEQSLYVLPSAETRQLQGGWILAAQHDWTPTPDTIIKTQFSAQQGYLKYQSVLWGSCKDFDERGACTDDFSGDEYEGQPVGPSHQGYGSNDFSSGEFPYAELRTSKRYVLNISAKQYFDFLGEHEAKVGLQADIISTHDVWPGLETGIENWSAPLDENGVPDPMDLANYNPEIKTQYASDLDARNTGTLISWYVQDVWNPTDRLTIRPGIRFDSSRLTNDLDQPVIGSLLVGPRFGVAYQFDKSGKTAAHGYYGRFYDTGFLGVASILNKKDQSYSQYSWDRNTNDWSTTPDFTTGSAGFLAGDLKNPYSDSYSLGLAQDLGGDWGLDITGTYSHSARFWEDDEVNLIWNEDGTDVVGYRNGVNETLYRLLTPDDVYVNYTDLEFQLSRQFGSNFSFIGSYTWSRSYGTNSSDQATATHDISQQYQYEVGLLDYDTPHNLKLSGTYTRPDSWAVGRVHGGFSLGFNSSFESGWIYRPIGWNDYYGGYNNYLTESDGAYRLPMLSKTDARFLVDFGLFRGDAQDRDGDGVSDDTVAWSAGLDVFNLFNERTVTSVNTEYGPDGNGVDGNFGQVLGRQGRRSAQLFVRAEF